MRRMIVALLLTAGLVACGPATPTPAPTVAETPSAAPVGTAAPTLATPTQAPTPSPLPTAAAGVPLCGVADLKASHGISDGAAGSILTEIVLVSDATCAVDSMPSLGLQDSKGSPLVVATTAGPGTIELSGGSAYTSQIRLANWCGADPSFPLALVLWIDSEKLVVTGGSFPQDGMPGCLADGGVRLEATPWVATP